MIETESLYKKYYNELYSFSASLCCSEDEAEDLVQDTFLKLHLAKEKGDIIENTRSWLFTVLYNAFLSTRKRSLKLGEIRESISYFSEKSTDPLMELELLEKKLLIRKEMQFLKENDRQILILYSEGLDYLEIAERMNIGRNYVGSYISRARNRLIKRLKRKYNELF
ncbi:MAG: RNA polymerase sigma factor [Marinilabiliaceae bacterium]|jgi:RNA polymerase sigma-70 factor (ECF subfamily)|nr:RNA polymerase sigma factor [Marinilabiliaceae bacterium]